MEKINLKILDQFKKRKLYIICMIVYCSLFILRDVFFLDIPLFVYLIWSSIMFFLFDVDECIALTLTIIVFGTGIQASSALGIGIVAICFKKGNFFKSSKLLILIIILAVYELLHAFIIPFDIIEYLRYLIVFVILAVIVGDKNIVYDNKFILKAFIFSTLFLLTDILLQTLIFSNFDLIKLIEKGYRFGNVSEFTEGITLSNNQNFIGELCLLSSAILLMFIYYSNKKNILNYFLLALFIFFGTFTESRTFVLVEIGILCIGSVLIMNKKLKHYKYSFFKIGGLIVFFITVITCFIVFMPSLSQSIIERFLYEDLTNGRDIILDLYNKFILSDFKILFFGVGLQDVLLKIKLMSNLDIIYSPHNAIQEIILCWGLVGLVLFSLIVFYIIKNAKLNSDKKVPLINYILFIALFTSIQAGQFVRAKEKVLLLILVFCCVQFNQFNKKEGNLGNGLKVAVRLDDICPTMNFAKFKEIISILKSYNVKPLLGVVPNNEDENLCVDEYKKDFFTMIKEMQKDGYAIAQHGYNHVYKNKKGGILALNKLSEGVGLSLENQKNKILNGKKILESKDIFTNIYMAPAHSYDRNTILALKECGFKYVTDGYTDYTYVWEGMIFIPCMDTVSLKNNAKGLHTLCIHSNTITDKLIISLKNTLEHYKDNLINYEECLKINPFKKFKLYQKINLYKTYTRSNLSNMKHKLLNLYRKLLRKI